MCDEVYWMWADSKRSRDSPLEYEVRSSGTSPGPCTIPAQLHGEWRLSSQNGIQSSMEVGDGWIDFSLTARPIYKQHMRAECVWSKVGKSSDMFLFRSVVLF